MESIRELRKICQTVHTNDYSAQIVRKVSIYITWLLIPTGITANAISIFNVFIGIMAGLFFYLNSSWSIVIGLLFFTLNTIIDGVDGEIARYRKESSLTGLYLDRLNSIFVYSFLFAGISFGQYYVFYTPLILFFGTLCVWGFVALRLIKTNIDATIIDAITNSDKAKIEKNTYNNMENRPITEYLRDKHKWYFSFIDFITIRQPGINIVLMFFVVSELLFRYLTNIRVI
ncbi:MAG: CDP-alcohol phosphatidyltransferase family protein, partial [Candidatus Helarchaeota archaeon]